MKNQRITYLLSLSGNSLCVVSFQHINNYRIEVFNITSEVGKHRKLSQLCDSLMRVVNTN